MSAVATETTTAIALICHSLRRRPWVSALAAAQDWLDHGVDAEAQLLRYVPGWSARMARTLRWPPLAALLLAAVDRRVPHSSRHLLCRKLWFHQTAARALRAGEQVVLLGAGLDPLGLRLAQQFPGSSIVEIDRTATVAIKRRWLAAHHPKVTHLRCVALDLELERGLAAAELAPDRATTVLAEGLFMYWPEARVRALLTALHATTPQPLTLGFSYLTPTALADPTSPVARLARSLDRRARGESFRWSLHPQDLVPWLAASGFGLRETAAAGELAAEFLGRRRAEYGEYVARAHVKER